MSGNEKDSNKLQILQLNANKSSNVLLSLLNDSTLADYGFLLSTEPWADLIQGPINKNKGSIAFIDEFTAWIQLPKMWKSCNLQLFLT